MKIMKKVLTVLFIAMVFSGCSNGINSEKQPVANQQNEVVAGSEQQPTSNIASAPDKVEVFLFHATQRCSTCIAIGKLSEKTILEKFPEEVKSGRIVFKEINIDLPENKELAEKFQASGSALYINAIKNGQDNIEQDTKVWRLTGDEDAFISYFENRLNMIISGKLWNL
jgi:PBP1b-binding outer membrane lipoprotein LpoB